MFFNVGMLIVTGLRAMDLQMMCMKHRWNTILSWVLALAVVSCMLVTILGYPLVVGSLTEDMASVDNEVYGWSYWLMIPCSALFIITAVLSLLDFVVLSHKNALEVFFK